MKLTPTAGKKWIFFDLGSTLIDETACLERRLQETLAEKPALMRDGFIRNLQQGYSMNQDGYRLAVQKYGLEKAPWRENFEQLYPQTVQVLQALCQKHRLGIIANQAGGSRERLTAWKISAYFDVIALSCELGVSKPEPAIFQYALAQAGCVPEQAWMIGDRLDNDILPAMELGMKTVWVKQGWGTWGNPDLLPDKPTRTIDHIRQILTVF